MTQLTIKHDVLAIEVKQDITARKGDILVVSSDGTYGVAVLPGVSFGIAESGNVVTSPKKALPKISAPSNNKSHRQKGRLDEELPELNEREFKYLDLLSKYEEPCTTKEIAVLCDEDYEKGHGAAQTNVLMRMVTALLVERERMNGNGTTQRNGVYGYSITRKGKRVLSENHNITLNLKEVA